MVYFLYRVATVNMVTLDRYSPTEIPSIYFSSGLHTQVESAVL